MAGRRDEFSDRDKAEIFVRDCALCCSGKSLWLLDSGAGPGSIDWVDHIVPASKGGLAELDNGLCASWVYNSLKRDGAGMMVLFFAGRPTTDFFTFHETVPDAIAAHLRRFSTLHSSDWYFNRAIFQLKLAAYQEGERRADGKRFSRGSEYRAKAALKFLGQWRKFAERDNPGDFVSRGLLPSNTSVDHELLISLAEGAELADLVRICSDLAPYCRASWQAFVDLSEAETKSEVLDLVARIDADPHVVPRVRDAIRKNVAALYD